MNRTVAFHDLRFFEALGIAGFVCGFAVIIFFVVGTGVLIFGDDIEESGWPALRAGFIGALLWVVASIYLILTTGVF